MTRNAINRFDPFAPSPGGTVRTVTIEIRDRNIPGTVPWRTLRCVSQATSR
jgi:hypothetical protein